MASNQESRIFSLGEWSTLLSVIVIVTVAAAGAMTAIYRLGQIESAQEKMESRIVSIENRVNEMNTVDSNQDTKIEYLQKQQEKTNEITEKMNDTLNNLNVSINKLQVAIDRK
ncbi:hypothetical protein phiAS5_ORF0118 [Aeromonas phage phiAS5]|uniref:Uncharacterized protein n=1 Tax=Aeromonas phage phiAS5 TaxID=879630 RepID=E1A2L5_9CAUD|nr:hypothetical protein phiAS5_ORF0118 [Aeromonas phage phiAS5]ADM79961.1 hypothetical protein phiAS5_ORF0118 [Aeromonas phage phiAS5]